jgi:hypothetical protein
MTRTAAWLACLVLWTAPAAQRRTPPTPAPLADISNTKKIDAVVVNGRLLNRTAIDDLLAGAGAASKGAGQCRR